MAEKETEFLPYKVIYKPGTGFYEEKKSRFIAYVSPASSEEEAVSFIDSIKKKHYDARHNCPAFIIGTSDDVVKEIARLETRKCNLEF